MALILEVVDPAGGAVRRVRVDALPFHIGRGYDNDLILDDPHVDARHARIEPGDEGAPVVRDLGSVNGLVPAGSEQRTDRFVAEAGAALRLGATLVRFRDPTEPVPPALPYVPAAPQAPPPTPWPATVAAQLAAPGAALVLLATYTWLGTWERSGRNEVVYTALGVGMLVALWAGVWAVASRVAVHRFHFLGHVAVASAVLVGVVLSSALFGWIEFLVPDHPAANVVGSVTFAALTAALVAAHLGLASRLSSWRRWRAGLVTGGVVLALGGLFTLVEDDTFTDVPEFSGVLKPVPAGWLPTGTVEGFGRMAQELKEEVDGMVEQDAQGDAGYARPAS